MKFLVFILFILFVPKKEYIVVDIKENQLNYVILLKDVKKEKLFLIESLKSDLKPIHSKKISVGDTISLKLEKIKVKQFKISQNIQPFDDLKEYDSLKVNKHYYCSELKGIFLIK